MLMGSNTGNADGKYFNLNTDYYLFLGYGPASGSTMLEHQTDPYISASTVDFQSTDIAASASLIKLRVGYVVFVLLISCGQW